MLHFQEQHQLSFCLYIRCENRLKTPSSDWVLKSVSPVLQDNILSYRFLKDFLIVLQLTKHYNGTSEKNFTTACFTWSSVLVRLKKELKEITT